MGKLVLKCEGLHKKYGKKEILKDVSVDVYEGDILGFIGPNGAGKTTTIKLILGLQSITQGNVEINGFNIEKEFTKAIEKVGAIIENPDMYMYLTGLQNLQLAANMYKNVDSKRIDEVVKLVGLENRIKDKVSKYSLGMRQRLGIAQAILHKPNLLILDEPTNGLDPEGIKSMRTLLSNLAKNENMGIFISSHNLLELESLCNKVCIIQNGCVLETSDVKDVKKMNNEECYILELDNTEGLKSITEQKMEVIDSSMVKIIINKNEVPELIEKLVKQGKKIYSVIPDEMTLEEAFLKKTGGNIIG